MSMTFNTQPWRAVAVLLLLLTGLSACSPADPDPIRIGLLFSTTGTMAASETPLVEAAQLAVAELNRQGGVLGRPIQPVVMDCRSDPATAATLAEEMIKGKGVAALFGCWTSTCRRAVRTVVERHRHLLFYPLQYEGLERSDHIFYTGSTPNQQITPAVNWAMEHLGKRLYLLGSDYLFPRTANQLIRELATTRGARVVGERYLPLGSREVAEAVAEIADLRPDVVLNTLNGDTNRHLFTALKQAGVRAKAIPFLSFSIAEVELAPDPARMAGHYAAWSYFQSVDTPRNREWVAGFRKRFGPQRVVDDPMEATWLAIHLWAQGVKATGTPHPEAVNRAIPGLSLHAPQGIVSVDPATRHLWRMVRIGQARDDGQFELVWSSRHPIRPNPFPYWFTTGNLLGGRP